MNTKSLLLSVLFATGFASQAWALDGFRDEFYTPPVTTTQPEVDRTLTKRYPDERRDSGKWQTYVGREVENKDGDVLGKVTELALDMKNGRVLAVIVSQEGPTAETPPIQVAVPPTALSEVKEGGTEGSLVLDVSPEKFAVAPRLNGAHWNDYFASGNMARVYRFFDVEPYFSTSTEMALGTVKRSSSVKGLPVWDEHSRVGHVTAVRVDQKTERLMYVIASEDSVISSKCDVLASHAKLNSGQTALNLDVPKQSGVAVKPLNLR